MLAPGGVRRRVDTSDMLALGLYVDAGIPLRMRDHPPARFANDRRGLALDWASVTHNRSKHSQRRPLHNNSVAQSSLSSVSDQVS